MKPIGPKLAEGRDSEMMEALGRPPFPLRRSGQLLAELHERLHRIPAPPDLRVAPVPGDRVVHRLTDRNVSPSEHTRMRELAVWASGPASPT